MSFYIQGLYLALIAFALISLLVGIHPFIRKITNNYYFWLIISIALITYCIVFRFYDGWEKYSNAIANGTLTDPENVYSQSIIISKALLTDFCPFFALAIPLSLIFDNKRKIASVLAPLSLFAGLITVFGQFPFDQNCEFTWHYIFIGDQGNELYYFLHLTNSLLAILVLLNTPKLDWYNFLFLNLFAIFYFIYIGIIRTATGVSWNVNGLSPNDWEGIGEYSIVSKVLGLKWPWVGLVTLIISYSSICLIIVVNNFTLKKIKWWKFDNIKGNFMTPYNIYGAKQKNIKSILKN